MPARRSNLVELPDDAVLVEGSLTQSQRPSAPAPIVKLPDDAVLVEGAATPRESDLDMAARYGVTQAAANTAGIADMVGMAADYLHNENRIDGDAPFTGQLPPRDPVTGYGLADATRAAVGPWMNLDPEFQPQTQGEQAMAATAEGAATFAVPGAAGLGYMRGIPAGIQALRGSRALSPALRAYGRAAGKNYRRYAAGLGGANLAGSYAGQYAQNNFGEDSTLAQMGLPMAAAMMADPLSARMAASLPGGGVRQARQGAAEAAPKARQARFRPKAFDRVLGLLRGRISEDGATIPNMIEARDHLHQVIFGRTEPITADDIQNAIDLGNEDLANSLRNKKRMFDDFMSVLGGARSQADDGVPLPTTAGYLAGADQEVGGAVISDLTSALGVADGGFAGDVVAKNQAAKQAAIADAAELSPVAQGAEVEGSPLSIQAAFERARGEAEQIAGSPWSSDMMADILGRTPPVSKSGIRRIINKYVADTRANDVDEASLDIESLMDRIDEFSEGGAISATNYHSILRDASDELGTANVPPKLAKRKRALYDQLREQLSDRFSPEDKAAFDKANADYAEYKRTYEPDVSRADKRRMTQARKRQSQVAKILGTVPANADDSLATVKALVKAPGTPAQVVAQVRKVLLDDPEAMAEIEQQVWLALLGPAVDESTTPAALLKALRINRGTVGLEDEGRMLAMYREIAGSENADKVEGLLRRGRQARYEDAGTIGGTKRTHSRLNAIIDSAEGSLPSAAKDTLFKVARAVVQGEPHPDVIAAAVREALLDPAALYDLLNVPSGKAYNDWQERMASRFGLSSVRVNRDEFDRFDGPGSEE